jgi:DNA gyrase subunit A
LSDTKNTQPADDNNEKKIEEQKLDLSNDKNIKNIEIVSEMEKSYLTYAMSVIVQRALPDVRDGLKPVHRRILYAMHTMGLRSSSKFRKSATVVGEVIGKYHPHGDSAVYDSMVRMAQDFAMRYQLVRGQGNFGSIDGDNAAAMRYTEAKMQKITDEILSDIEKETIDWRDNYDGSLQEPTVLPSRIPNLLLNGSTGIAVGMATSIPPHNLGELIDGIMHLSNNPEATLENLMQFIKGPDFPTAGIIYSIEDIKKTYATGRGGIVMRGKTEIIEKKNGKYEIIITEIPYQVNKANMISKMAELTRDKKIIGITDIRDESNKEGIRVVVELKKDSYPKKILNQLFKYTQLQEQFNMNMIALVDQTQPHLLDLKQVLAYFIDHRKVVIRRRTEYELKIAKARAHILEGLKIALDSIDEVIETIRKSDTKEDALESLMSKFKLTEIQGKAILEMRLQTLAGLERQKIENELAEKIALIKELEGILADPGKILKIMQDELAEIKEKYADKRKTQIIPHAVNQISAKDTIPNEAMIVMLTRENYIKSIQENTFRSQKRGGKGVIGTQTKEEDEIKIIRFANNLDELLYFTNKGRVFKLPVYEIPRASKNAKGQPIVNLLQLQKEEFVTSILNIGEKFSGKYLMMATKQGVIKKTAIEDFKNVRKTGLIAIKLRDQDSLEWVKETAGNDEIMIITKNGMSIRFSEKDVRSMGRSATGVRGIKLKKDDKVVEMDCIKEIETSQLFVVMENGKGKMSFVKDYRTQSRGGTGVKTAKLSEKTGKIVGAKIMTDDDTSDLIMISKHGQVIRMSAKTIPVQGRTTQGVTLMRFADKTDAVASLSFIDSVEETIEKKPEENQEKTKQQAIEA